jgi:hypothetical protein
MIIEPHRKLAFLTVLTCTCIHALSNCCPSCSRVAIAWLLGSMYYSRCEYIVLVFNFSEVTCVLSGLARLFIYGFS